MQKDFDFCEPLKLYPNASTIRHTTTWSSK